MLVSIREWLVWFSEECDKTPGKHKYIPSTKQPIMREEEIPSLLDTLPGK